MGLECPEFRKEESEEGGGKEGRERAGVVDSIFNVTKSKSTFLVTDRADFTTLTLL